jgi:aminoglycoside 6'-N-acetyltransferase I
MTIVDLDQLSAAQQDQLTELTFDAGAEHSPGWHPTLASARETIDEARDKLARVLLDEEARPVAWIAASHDWGRLWEIHPMIVARAHQRRGFGRLLVREIEVRAARAGALTLTLSTSDMTGATSLSGVDLFADPARRLVELTTTKPHPVSFWIRLGFVVVGVTPDAEGPGMPSISLAKRLSSAMP